MNGLDTALPGCKHRCKDKSACGHKCCKEFICEAAPQVSWNYKTVMDMRAKGFRDGPATVARFGKCVRVIALDNDDDIIVQDRDNFSIRKISKAGIVSTLAGSGAAGFRDGPGSQAQFDDPRSGTVDRDGNVFVVDTGRIRKISPKGAVSTLAGGLDVYIKHRNCWSPDGVLTDGGKIEIWEPSGIAVDGGGNAFVADRGYMIWRITSQGLVTLLAGSIQGFREGPGLQAQFSQPESVILDQDGCILVADQGNGRIRKVTPSGMVSTIAGNGKDKNKDGPHGSASFDDLDMLAIDGEGNIFVSGNCSCVRKVSATGVSSLEGYVTNGLAVNRKGDLVLTLENKIIKISGVAKPMVSRQTSVNMSSLVSKGSNQSEEGEWEQACLEAKMERCSLADFRALTLAEVEEVLGSLPVIKRGKLRRLHQNADTQRSTFPPGLPRILSSDLEVGKELGKGSFSTVYRGVWTRRLQVGRGGACMKEVAIKVPHTGQSTADLLRELAVLSNLPHQNLLQLYGVCEANPPKLVVEYMNGDLATALKKQSLKTRYQKLRVLKDIAAALNHLHRNGVAHRDVKPHNVLLGEDQTKLCDLGLSKDLKHSAQKMTAVGTLMYMAPEMQTGEATGTAADVWSFGIVLYEVLMGQLPDLSPRADPVSEMRKAECLKPLCDIFAQCHSHKPDQRPSMAEVETKLMKLLMYEMQDHENLKAELRTAQAQDLKAYTEIWENNYENQAEMTEVLVQARELAREYNVAVRQPRSVASYDSLASLANRAADELHRTLQSVVEACNGRYMAASRKSQRRVVQKVIEEYDGDYGRLVDLERATGLFTLARDFGRCLKLLSQGGEWKLCRMKDRMTKSLESGYRDLLLNVLHRETSFVFELQLNFEKIAEIKSQSHAYYEMMRVMKLQA